jgi:hypothetical protein
MGFEFVMGRELIQDAYKHGMNVSSFLERLDPTTQYPAHERNMDAFERQLAKYDIRTRSDPRSGVVCHAWDRFYETDELGTKEERSALAAEWLSRQYRRATAVAPRNGFAAGEWNSRQGFINDLGNRFPNADTPISYTLYPPEVYDQLRYQMLQPSMLNVLVSRIRVINSETFAALYLSDSVSETAARMSRVEEFGEIPAVTFTTGEQTIRVKKYGRSLKVSYEQLRRMQLDLVSWAVLYIAAKADRDKEDTAVDVLINGDGNSGTAATSSNGTALDSVSGNKMTLKMWLLWRLLWRRPYTSNVMIGGNAALVDMFLLSAGSANLGPIMYLGANVPDAVNVRMARTTLDGLLAVDNSTVPANQLLAVDSNWTLEMAQEAGADIVQTDQIMQNQYNQIMITESVGFCIATKGQNRILAYTA